MQLTLGQIYADKYRIVRLLGEGAMGAVYEAENMRIRRRVAIKILHPQIAQKADTLRRFEREAQAAGRIGSQHIVEVLDLGELADGSRFMVLEFLDGTTLDQRIRSRGRLTPEDATPIVCQLLEGLGAAHKAEIIHRDLKPANVYLCPKPGGVDFVKILDFGVSKFNVLNDEMSMTSTGAVLGTPYYMSPEQAKGSREVDPRSDLYAVGVILYECITGQVPFSAETFNELIFRIVLESPPPVESFVPNLDLGFTAIIHKAMAREAGERFQTAEEFRGTLLKWLEQSASGPVVPAALGMPTPPPYTGPSAAAGPAAPPGGPGLPGSLGIGGTMLMDPPARASAQDLNNGRTMAMDPRAPIASPAWSPSAAPRAGYGAAPNAGYGAGPNAGYGAAPHGHQPPTTQAFPVLPPGFEQALAAQPPGLDAPPNGAPHAGYPNAGYPNAGYPGGAAPGAGGDGLQVFPDDPYTIPKRTNGVVAFVGGLLAVLVIGGGAIALVNWKAGRTAAATSVPTASIAPATPPAERSVDAPVLTAPPPGTTAAPIAPPPGSVAAPIAPTPPAVAAPAPAPDAPGPVSHAGATGRPGVSGTAPKSSGKAGGGPSSTNGKRTVSGEL
jgi:eukaryotic-like serine/threonine-protein kinase